jgi:arginase family enzyme
MVTQVVHPIFHAASGGYMTSFGLDLSLIDRIKVMDFLDIEIKLWDVQEIARRAISRVSDIVRACAVPTVTGGDHSASYMSLRAISDYTEGHTGIIGFL